MGNLDHKLFCAWLVASELSTLSGSVILLILYKLRTLEQPVYWQYGQDIIHGALWRWSWSGNSIYNLWCYCPACDCELVYEDSSCRSLYGESHTDFLCEPCGNRHVASISGGNRSYAISAVEREIWRKLRTEEYKKVLTKACPKMRSS
jgi:hypothetical protein